MWLCHGPTDKNRNRESRDETVDRAFLVQWHGRRAALDRVWLGALLDCKQCKLVSHSPVSGTVPCSIVGRAGSALALDDAMRDCQVQKEGRMMEEKKRRDLMSVCTKSLC